MGRKRVLSRDVPGVPTNFLLTCSDITLSDYELKNLADVANTRTELHEVLDRLIDQTAQAGIVRWFRNIDREALKQALDNPDDVLAMAREQIRDGQRSEEDLIPRSLLPPGSAHIAASLRYQEKNVKEGLCAVCPTPLAHNSVRFCEKHLTMARLRHKPKNAKGEPPGSIGWLYGEGFESQHGRQPGTLKALALAREKRTEKTKPSR
jgi:hypothetical protein